MKTGYLIRYYENAQFSSGGYWVENYYTDLEKAISYYLSKLSYSPEFHECFESKIGVGLKTKIKSWARQFRAPCRIKVTHVEFE